MIQFSKKNTKDNYQKKMLLKNKEKELGLQFNLGLVAIDLQRTGPW